MTNVVTPTMFNAQRSADMQQLLKISEALGSVCSAGTGLKDKPVKDKVCFFLCDV